MKTVFLIRHAESSWDDAALRDKDRPLDGRGKRDTPKTGKRLAKRDVEARFDAVESGDARAHTISVEGVSIAISQAATVACIV
jgi:phosphohistidine phosphatase SixA